MEIIGVIAEYNPFHNGHLYHLNTIKKMYPNSIIILVLNGNFLQRGETSIINKWDKTKIALYYGIDIVLELPFVFGSQSADIFAKGSIGILKHMKVDKLIFGSESNNISLLKELAKIQLLNPFYDSTVKRYLNIGENYPTAISKGLEYFSGNTVTTPNDILGITYIKEIIIQNTNIEPITIKRTNNYHSIELVNNIVSATAIRNEISNNHDISKYVPQNVIEYVNNISFYENYFPFLKYKIISNINNLNIYQTVDEGIENRIKKHIYNSNTMEELIKNIKTKRYTYNKIRRMLTHILTSFTKEEAKKYSELEYIRLLGFSKNGQSYLNKIKKDINVPLITNLKQLNKKQIEFEMRITSIYASVMNKTKAKELIEKEYKNKPIFK